MQKNIKNIISALLIIVPFLGKSQTHEYIFNNNLNELNGGPALTEILACGAGAGAYGVQTAGTTGGACLTSNSFCFNDGGGLQYPNSGLITGSFTINMFFRFSTLGGWARVIDFSNSTSDAGVYFLGNCLNFYPNGNIGLRQYWLDLTGATLNPITASPTTTTTYTVTGTSSGCSGTAVSTVTVNPFLTVTATGTDSI